MDKYNIKLREDATPYHAKPYPVPHSQEQKLRKEVARIEKINVLRKKKKKKSIDLNGDHQCLPHLKRMAHYGL